MVAESIIGFVESAIWFLKWFWWLIVLGILFGFKYKWKDWVMDIVVIEKRGENLIKTNDRARKYIDNMGLVKYQMLKTKDTTPVINYNWVLHNNNVHTNILERFINLLRPTVGTIFFFRYGSKQYKPIQIKTKEGIKTRWEEIKENGESKYINIYEQFDPRDKLGSLKFDVMDWDNMNFMVQEQRSSVERRKNSRDKLMQILLPIAAIALTALVVIFMLYFGYQYATDLRTSAPNTPQQTERATQPNIPVIGDIVPGA